MGPGFIHIDSMTQTVNISSLTPSRRLLQIQGPTLGKRPVLRGGLDSQGPVPPSRRDKTCRVFLQLDQWSDARSASTPWPATSRDSFRSWLGSRSLAGARTPAPPAGSRQSRATRPSVSSGLLGVREVARKEPRTRFTALLHHVTVDLLRDSYFALKREAAPGVDGVTWEQYGTDLETKLVNLHSRVHQGTYRAQPSSENSPSRHLFLRKQK